MRKSESGWMKSLAATVFAVLALASAAPASAHHSAAATYDLSRKVEISGEFSKLAWINPHIGFEVKTTGAKPAVWRFETRPPGYFVRNGVDKATLDSYVGQKVRVQANPARDGSTSAWALKVTFADGAELELPGE